MNNDIIEDAEALGLAISVTGEVLMEYHGEWVVITDVLTKFAALRDARRSPDVGGEAVIKAKPIKWEDDHGTWYGNDYGFQISLEDDGYNACWGEGDTETFKTLDEAKEYCQKCIDDYIASVALFTAPPQLETVQEALEKAICILQDKIGTTSATPMSDAIDEIRALIQPKKEVE